MFLIAVSEHDTARLLLTPRNRLDANADIAIAQGNAIENR
jgi:hypothetical protein